MCIYPVVGFRRGGGRFLGHRVSVLGIIEFSLNVVIDEVGFRTSCSHFRSLL